MNQPSTGDRLLPALKRFRDERVEMTREEAASALNEVVPIVARRILSRRGLTDEDCEDIIEHVKEKAVAGWFSGNTPDEAHAWVRTCARNQAISLGKSAARKHPHQSLDDPDGSLSDGLPDHRVSDPAAWLAAVDDNAALRRLVVRIRLANPVRWRRVKIYLEHRADEPWLGGQDDAYLKKSATAQYQDRSTGKRYLKEELQRILDTLPTKEMAVAGRLLVELETQDDHDVDDAEEEGVTP
jgi:DNA-directed RNA polymerase specialized sigma24 family protein